MKMPLLVMALLCCQPIVTYEDYVKASTKAFGLIKEREGLRLVAYPDSKGYAVGYGQTGPDIVKGTTITVDQAEAYLRGHVTSLEERISALIKHEITQNQFDAIVSFVYNVGLGNFKSSTMLKLINEGKANEAGSELLKWTRVKGTFSPGLLVRRKKELELYNTP
jgi:lysozyme